MNKISTLLDNIYSGNDLTLESRFINSIDNIHKECLSKKSSRYKLSGINYSPYKLTKESFGKLFNNIILIPDLLKESSEILVSHDERLLVVKLVDKLDNLLYNGDYTTNGLLAIRYMKSFGNQDFRDKVNQELSKFMIHYEYKLRRYFIDKDIYDLILKYEDDLLTEKLVNRYGFRWRD